MATESEHYSLSKALRETGFSASVISTFNAYLPFYEEVVLRRLLASGCTNNVVLMDARQCAEALSQESMRPRRAGVDYTLVPVASPGAFHPKILLRLGKRKGSLFVGSHNLTVAGFGLNDELTNRLEYDGTGTQGLSCFAATVELLRGFVSGSSPEAAASLDAAIEVAPWLSKLHAADGDTKVLGTRSEAPSLWDQVRSEVTGAVRRILVIAPYFDEDLAFLRRVATDFPEAKVVAAVDPATVHINVVSRRKLGRVRFVNLRGRVPSTGRREAVVPFLHAKALLLETEAGEVLVSGSANASGAAFLEAAGGRNAECVVLRRLAGEGKVTDELGLRAFLEATALAEAEWDSIASRMNDVNQLDAGSSTRERAALAIVDGEVLRIDGLHLEAKQEGRAFDSDGHEVGTVLVGEAGPPAILTTASAVLETATLLRLESHGRELWTIVHRPGRIAENYGSDTRRALRQALGSLDEDPAQLEVLLKLSEKVIFDDEALIEKVSPANRGGTSTGDKKDNAPEEATSLALDAAGRRAMRRGRSIASGDITVLLDALIHSLGRGGAPSTGQEGNEEERVGTDDDTDKLPPEEPNRERLAAACRRKTRTLARRLITQVDVNVQAAGQSRRSIIQTAAVLGILRALRTIELRDDWRRSGHRLVDQEALEALFREVCPMMAVGADAVVPSILAELGGESCEEVSMVLGLLASLAWECDVDLEIAVQRDGRLGVEQNQWPRLQCLAYLAPFLDDERALDIASTAIRETPRRGHDGDSWLNLHLGFIGDVAAVAHVPEACERLTRPPRPGDIVLLPAQFEPRVRVVADVGQGSQGTTITVVDEDTNSGIRKFLADRVCRLVPPLRLQAAG